MSTTFPGLTPSDVLPDSRLHSAQRYLAASYDSVAGLVEITYPALRATREASRGRLTEPEQDVFRAAIVVAGAGVDTVLKEALRTCLSAQIGSNTSARDTFVDWVTRYIQSGQALNPRRIAELLTGDPVNSLQGAYINSLTTVSLQSQTQVTTALGALGFHPKDDKQLYVDASLLNPLFRVRNQIAHEMDMTPTAIRGQGDRTRNDRTIKDYVSMSHTGLDYCQRVLNTLESRMKMNSEG